MVFGQDFVGFEVLLEGSGFVYSAGKAGFAPIGPALPSDRYLEMGCVCSPPEPVPNIVRPLVGAMCAKHFTSSARPTSVDVMSAIGSTVVKVGHHPIVTTKRRASSAAFKCSISSNMPLTTTPFLNAMKPRWTPWPQHADLTPGKKPIHGSHPSVFCS